MNNIKRIISLTALAGALVTGGVAFADHDDDRYSSSYRYEDLDVIGSATLRGRKGVVEYKITPGVRRDGLQLRTDADRLRITSIQLEYDDGRIAELRGRQLRETLTDGELFTFQRGRPGGLRHVRIGYAMPRRDRGARLELIQIHDGDGYTKTHGERDFVRQRRQ